MEIIFVCRILHCWLGDMSDVISSCCASLDWTTVAHHPLLCCVSPMSMLVILVFPAEWKTVERESAATAAFNDECFKELMNASKSVEFLEVDCAEFSNKIDGQRIGGYMVEWRYQPVRHRIGRLSPIVRHQPCLTHFHMADVWQKILVSFVHWFLE